MTLSRYIAVVCMSAALCAGQSAAVAAAPTRIVSAKFGLFVPSATGGMDFREVKSIPLIQGLPYGWVVDLETELAEVEWREELRLPSAPRTWGSRSEEGPSVSADGKTSIIQKRVQVNAGRIFNIWRVAPEDPMGDYAIRLQVEGLKPVEFRFTVASLSHSNPLPVAAGQRFPGAVLDIRAPDSDGWSLTRLDPEGMHFFRPGGSEGETYVAMVRFFLLPVSPGQEGLLKLLRDSFEKQVAPPRFEIIRSRVESIQARGYACVGTVADVRDKQAFFGRAVLTLQWHALTCRHPVRQEAGFEISYSHRGTKPDPRVEEQARSFIAGVQVPDS